MTRTDTILYTASTHTTGGRDGAAKSSDGRLDVKLSPPGSEGLGTNPEQLLPPAGRPASSAPCAAPRAR